MNYMKLYEQVISRAQSERRVKSTAVYYESHHVYPKCYCKDDLEYLVKDKRNLVLLTAKEHYTAHHLLMKIFKDDSMVRAFWGMSTLSSDLQDRVVATPRQYQTAREAVSSVMSNRVISPETRKKLSDANRDKHFGKDNNFYGKTHTDETKKLISEGMSGEKHCFYGKKRPEHSAHMKIVMKGKLKSEEHKENISKSHNVVYTCPHCDKSGGRIMLRWHFDNCKHKE